MICAGSRNPPEAICLDYTWYANPRGICPFCRDDFAVLGDGTLRTHNADRGRVVSENGVVGHYDSPTPLTNSKPEDG